ncbi:MAG TPA: AMP-binding protein, partial [Microthrixaceae bacterium]|nr:AMP-binding protein [Microthrixaceae bacterium]
MLGEIVRTAADRFGDREVLRRATDALTYRDLDAAADRVAAGLTHRGIGPGDVVSDVLPSCAEWVVLAVALDRIGAVHAPVSPKLTAPERAELVALVAPDLVVTDRAGVEGLPLRSDVVVVEPGDRGEPLWGPRRPTTPDTGDRPGPTTDDPG